MRASIQDMNLAIVSLMRKGKLFMFKKMIPGLAGGFCLGFLVPTAAGLSGIVGPQVPESYVWVGIGIGIVLAPVSYTHLTLPTICSV